MQELLTSPLEGRPERCQLSFLCDCGKRLIELKTLGCCHRCYDRRYHSLRLFGGMRERVLERDRHNEPKVLVTLCCRCHVRIQLPVRHWLAGLFLKLWRELHRHEPMQLRLAWGRQEQSVRKIPSTKRTARCWRPLPVGRENRRGPMQGAICAALAVLGPGGGRLS